jgi:hypothetical protein
MIDESGQLSLDFIIGFTIFMLAFIFVATLSSGLIIGLQSKTIDYDAVAYRTGVILVEDPGEPSTPTYATQVDPMKEWELLDKDHKDSIIRLGLAISKDNPNIISRAKADKFFNQTYFDNSEDYRNKLLFNTSGQYPYYFNIALTGYTPVGNPYPNNTGFIKRAVYIKEPSEANFTVTNYTIPLDVENFGVLFDLPALYNSSRGPIYWIDPFTENITIRLSREPNNSYISKYGTNDVLQTIPGIVLPPIHTDGSNYTQIFPPGYFADFADRSDRIIINYTFSDSTGVNYSVMDYNYTIPNIQRNLTPAILEVRVW